MAARPETERSLKAALRITVAVAVFWTLAGAYGVWLSRAALAAAQSSVLLKSNQMSQIEQALPDKRRAALKADGIKALSSQKTGNADITVECADLARSAGAEFRGVRIGDSGQMAAAAQPSPAPAQAGPAPGAGAAPAAPASAPANARTSETFECSIAGEYPALTRFLSGLAASDHILDITSLQVTGGSAKAETGTPRLEMKISGTVSETAGKP